MIKLLKGSLIILLMIAAQPALAQEAVDEEPFILEEDTPETVVIVPEGQPSLVRLPNIGFEMGGGFQTFTGELGDVTEGGAGYGVRAIWGARTRIGAEFGFLGSWNSTESEETAGNRSADVYTNTGETLLRFNFLSYQSPIRPFVAGGVNYTRIDSEVNTPVGAVFVDGRDGIGFPFVAGLQYMPTPNLSFSARGNYTVLSNFIDDQFPSGNLWGGTINVGAIF